MPTNNSLESIFHLVHALKREFATHLMQLNYEIVPMHMRVIRMINSTPSCTAIDIAHYLDRDKAQVTRLIASLIEKDLLIKVANPADKRSQFLQLTKKGQTLMADLKCADEQVIEKMMRGMEEKERLKFEQMIKNMVMNLENIPK